MQPWLSILLAFAVTALVGLLMCRPAARGATRKAEGPSIEAAPEASIGIGMALAAGILSGIASALPGSHRLQIIAVAALALGLLAAWRDGARGPAWAAAVIAASSAVVAALPSGDLVFQGALPLIADRIVAGLLLASYVDLWSRMDGIDALPGVEAVAVAGGFTLLMLTVGADGNGLDGLALAVAGAAAASLLWTWPPASSRIGPLGSAMLGLCTGALMIDLAASSLFAAAFILPLYLLADGLLSASRGTIKGGLSTAVGGGYFHVRAARGLGAESPIIGRIVAVNVLLVAAALFSRSSPLQAFATAAAAVTLLLVSLERASREE